MERQHGAREGGRQQQDPPDRELIDRVRAGDLEAYDPLYQRHARSALLHARHWARGEAAAEDLRAEAFTRVLHAIRNGNGPTEAFRPYLLTTMRHVARDWAQGERRVLLVPDAVDLEAPAPQADPVLAALERSLAGQAFMTLPERWQTVLWHTEVEGEGPAQLAPQLGLDPAAVAALAYRAREGLKQAYLQAHITQISSESCRPFAQRLGAAARGKLGRREDGKLQAHLRHCAECAGLLAMLKYVNAHIGVLAAPAVVGTAVAAKAVFTLAAGAGAAAGTAAAGAAGSGGSGAAHAGLLGRGAAKLRHASPRQQAVALGTAAAVAAAALAFALAGSPAAPRPRPTASSSAAAAPAPSNPAPAPPSASPSPSPSPPAPPPPSPSPAPRRPRPSASHSPAPAPSSLAPSPSPSPAAPSPSASPVQVMCPGIAADVLGIELRLDLDVRVNLGVTQLLVSSGCQGGPPTPF